MLATVGFESTGHSVHAEHILQIGSNALRVLCEPIHVCLECLPYYSTRYCELYTCSIIYYIVLHYLISMFSVIIIKVLYIKN